MGQKGFTLIELIVVIAIIAILAGVAVPSMENIIGRAEGSVDMAQIKMLNDATQAYAVQRNICDRDIFQGFSTDATRIDELIAAGFFGEPPQPTDPDEEYYWNIDNQVWNFSKYVLIDGNILRIVFDENFTVEDYVRSGNSGWLATSDGLEGTNRGILFIPNDRDEYTITTEAVLDTGTGHGYGIMFDTTVDHGLDENSYDDNGYCLQFDRGYGNGEIIIRQRIDGKEQSPEVRISHDDFPDIIPDNRNDPWWSEQHEIKTDIKRIDDDTKTVTVYIDGVAILQDHEYETDIQAGENNSGFRVWGETTQYKTITIE